MEFSSLSLSFLFLSGSIGKTGRLLAFSNQCLFVFFCLEKVNIVHGHSAFSSLAHEALFVASLLGNFMFY